MGFRRLHFFSGRMTSRAQRAPRGQLASLGAAGPARRGPHGRAALRRAVLWASPGVAGRMLCRGRHRPVQINAPRGVRPAHSRSSRGLAGPQGCSARDRGRRGARRARRGRQAGASRASGRLPSVLPRVLRRPVAAVVFASKPQHRVAGCALVLRHARKASPRERESLGSRSLAPIALA